MREVVVNSASTPGPVRLPARAFASGRYHDAVEYELKMTNLIRLVRIDTGGRPLRRSERLEPGRAHNWQRGPRSLPDDPRLRGPRRRHTSRWKMWLDVILLFAAAPAAAYWASHR